MSKRQIKFIDAANIINISYDGRQDIHSRINAAKALDDLCEKYGYFGVNINAGDDSALQDKIRTRLKGTDPRLDAFIEKDWNKGRMLTHASARLIPFLTELPSKLPGGKTTADQVFVSMSVGLYDKPTIRDAVATGSINKQLLNVTQDCTKVIDSILGTHGLKTSTFIHSAGAELRIHNTDTRDFSTYGTIDICFDTIFSPTKRISVEQLANMSNDSYWNQMKKLKMWQGGKEVYFFTARMSMVS